MKSVRVDYEEKDDGIALKESAKEESWVTVCRRFNDDVHRLRDVSGMGVYTGLYRCFDDDNREFYYMVEEDETLYQLKHRQFLNKLGGKSVKP